MKTTLIYLLTLLMAIPVSGLGQSWPAAFKESIGESLASYTVVIPATEFKKTALIQLAEEYLAKNKELKLVQVGIFSDKDQARDSLGKGIFDFSYDIWRTEFDRRKKEKEQAAAVLLKYGANATLRIKYADGRTEEVTIAGKDAFHPQVNNVTLSLLQVSLVDQGFGINKKLTPHFYFVVPRTITTDEATALAKSIIQRVGIPRAVVHFREDEWFIFDAHYPWVNPFATAELLPSESEVAKSSEFLCRSSDTEACYQTSTGRNHSPKMAKP